MGYKFDKQTDRVDIKDYFTWVVSLLGPWWIVLLVSLPVALTIGLLGTLLVGVVLPVVSLAVWVLAGHGDESKIKMVFTSLTSYLKEWWDNRPSPDSKSTDVES